MRQYSYTADPPDNWDKFCAENGALFGTVEWQAVLEKGFPCQTIYGWNGIGGLTITMFRIGPFRVGYVGFPVGALIGIPEPCVDHLPELKRSDLGGLVACVHVPVSAFGRPVESRLPFQVNPETAITHLQDWNPTSVSKNLRRDIRKAERAGFEVIEVKDTASAATLYEIYAATVKLHSGARRYNASYFSALVDLGSRCSELRIMAARHLDRIASFAVTARHAGTTYYLHGGTDARYRRQSPSDLLLDKMIHAAQEDGSDCFNLMASPSDQPSLVRYKQKWGATTRELRTYTLPLSWAYQPFRLAQRIHRFIW